MSFTRRLRTLWALGPANVARVGLYRALLRLGVHPVQRLKGEVPAGPFFHGRAKPGNWPEPDVTWLSATRRFDWMEIPLPPGGIPDWLENPFGQHGGAVCQKPWWTIGDFGAGDIKGLWELSRMGWVPALAGAALADIPGASRQLNDWLEDWCRVNPPYFGPNWKCGQEAAIRVMHLVAAALILDEVADPLPGLLDLVAQHLARIAPTMSYAIGQDNNHGTSEAAAMFVGGDFLQRAGHADGAKWRDAGKKHLEERGLRLIGADGSFSQHSVTYHRVMLDSYSFTQSWIVRHGLSGFSDRLTVKLQSATEWLRAVIDPETGVGPLIGASDGARLFPVSRGSYQNFRSSAQWASSLFLNTRAFEDLSADAMLVWLGLPLGERTLPKPRSVTFDSGGWHVLVSSGAKAVMRYPRFLFRPSHADALHVDLWVNGNNLLLDCGTLSYNDAVDPDADYSGAAYHNTICFDQTDPMPRISRFLFGEWLKAQDVDVACDGSGVATAAAGYRTHRGACHRRAIRLHPETLHCIDTVSGNFAEAVLRWHLPAGDWQLKEGVLTGASLTVSIEADNGCEVSARVGQRAAHYQLASSCFIIEARLSAPGEIRSIFNFSDQRHVN